MEELKKLFRLEYLVALFGISASIVSWYFGNNQMNQLQNDKISQAFSELRSHNDRLVQLEKQQNSGEMQTAIIKVQLDAIQSDLRDIKAELKKK